MKETSKSLSQIKTSSLAFIRLAVLPADTVSRLCCSTEELVKVVVDLMDDLYVREAVWLASPALLARYDYVRAGNDAKDTDVFAAVAKYLIRMAYRSTPFGTFACVGTASVAASGSLAAPTRRDMYRHVQASTAAVSQIASSILRKHRSGPQLSFHPNDTLNVRDGRASWIAYSISRKGKRIYRNEEVEIDGPLETILELSRSGLRLTSLGKEAMKFLPDSSEEEIGRFLDELVEAQLLCCDSLLDLTTDDLLQGMEASLIESEIHGSRLADAQARISRLCGQGALSVPSSYNEAIVGLAELQGAGVEPSEGAVKVDLYARHGLGSVCSRVIKDVEEAIAKFAVFSEKSNGLTRFATSFSSRYGDLEVPLLEIASELAALGYVERSTSAPSILRFLGATSGTKSREGAPVTCVANAVEQLISSAGKEYIDLRSSAQSQTGIPANLPETAIVSWLSLWKSGGGDLIEIRSIGAQRAGRVMGRFAYQLPELRSLLVGDGTPCGSSDEIPAEIVHLPEDDLGSVCARPVLSTVEIGIRAGPSRRVQRVDLADLVIMVRDGRVLVKSRSLGRLLSVRMSNAHAVERPSSLPLYRFLSSIANQGQAVSIPTLRDRFPTAPYLPGLRFKDVIISRPTWYLASEKIGEIAKLKGNGLVQGWRALCDQMKIPHEVALVQGDRVIPFDTRVEWMLTELVRHLKRSEKSILTTTSPLGLQPAISADDGPRAHEIQLVHKIGGGKHGHVSESCEHLAAAVKASGADWIFVKIYSAAESASSVLRVLANFCSERRVELFFVRYRDERGFHLRVRLKSRASEWSLQAIAPLMQSLESLRRAFIVQEVSFESYVRELQRYGGDSLLEKIEDVWVCESQLLLQQSERLDDQDGDYWKHVAVSIDRLLISLGYTSLHSRLEFAARAAADFHSEIGFTTIDRKRIGRLFASARHRLSGNALAFDGIDSLWCEALVPKSLTDQIQNELDMLPKKRKYSISWAMIHMRVNRMLIQDHRYQEAVVWELLKRSYVAFTKGRSAAAEESAGASCA
ncbi:thiopeptide-type bacteriocin biosynthesis protein [Stenotrophomonas lactitubi]|uniref:thiopeptide-type bacteriocin biosynthesis protein n=1 Tax=Stenotrophomonas lactitubi TaxID=2045214 RepID=UPI00224926FC|nr:thiopeptide-type bacteriocin biosynthesis protein [Stenotrophomonas lactitubi]MCX2892732.1 thiopeptide-type bacteriocin biosynthesis protein [Stenotrophomonas lactitubi]